MMWPTPTPTPPRKGEGPVEQPARFFPSPLVGRGQGWGSETMITRIPAKTRQTAQRLRRDQTPSERRLWPHLKQLKVSHGLHFRSQAPIGPYIADFVCFGRKLVVELDGESHLGAASIAHDAARDGFLQQQGFRVLRFSNPTVNTELFSVVETILHEVSS